MRSAALLRCLIVFALTSKVLPFQEERLTSGESAVTWNQAFQSESPLFQSSPDGLPKEEVTNASSDPTPQPTSYTSEVFDSDVGSRAVTELEELKTTIIDGPDITEASKNSTEPTSYEGSITALWIMVAILFVVILGIIVPLQIYLFLNRNSPLHPQMNGNSPRSPSDYLTDVTTDRSSYTQAGSPRNLKGSKSPLTQPASSSAITKQLTKLVARKEYDNSPSPLSEAFAVSQ